MNSTYWISVGQHEWTWVYLNTWIVSDTPDGSVSTWSTVCSRRCARSCRSASRGRIICYAVGCLDALGSFGFQKWSAHRSTLSDTLLLFILFALVQQCCLNFTLTHCGMTTELHTDTLSCFSNAAALQQHTTTATSSGPECAVCDQ